MDKNEEKKPARNRHIMKVLRVVKKTGPNQTVMPMMKRNETTTTIHVSWKQLTDHNEELKT